MGRLQARNKYLGQRTQDTLSIEKSLETNGMTFWSTQRRRETHSRRRQ